MADDGSITGGDIQAAETSLAGGSPDPASSPESTPAVSASADAIVQPADGANQPEVQPSTSTAGVPPEQRWPSILENQRKEAADRAVTEWRGKYGWAEQVNPQEFQQLQRIASKFASGDPVTGIQELIAEIRKDPQHDAAIRSFAARTLAQKQQASQPREPEFMVPQADGSIVFDPNGFAQWKQWNVEQTRQSVLSQFQQEIAPLKQSHEQHQAAVKAAQHQQEIAHFATSTLQDVQTWPGMDQEANRIAVAKELERAQVNSDDPREVSLALNAAYRKAVLPTLHTASRQAVLNDINRQANAGTVNPAQSSTRAPKSIDDMSIAEALAHTAAQMGSR